MQYLNFMYASPEWNNLFMYGEQDVDYTLNDENLVVQKEDSDYAHVMQWIGPAEFKAYVKEGNPPDLWEQYIDFNNNSLVSLASGFSFDTARSHPVYRGDQCIQPVSEVDRVRL